jgi:hypothetical protein
VHSVILVRVLLLRCFEAKLMFAMFVSGDAVGGYTQVGRRSMIILQQPQKNSRVIPGIYPNFRPQLGYSDSSA